jgi:leucyl aminopeptidase (aminopeptidase T)
MKRFFVFCFLIAAFFLQQNLFAQPKGIDYNALAQKLVTLCADIKESEIVLITGSVRDARLLEDIAVHVRKVGAFPLISISSDRLTRRMYTDVPVKFDSQKSEWDVKLADVVNSIISVDVGEEEGLLADIPPERFAVRAKANEGITKLFQDQKVRMLNLGNALYPTKALAKRFKVPMNELTNIFWNGVNVNYTKLQATGDAVRNRLENGKQVRITTPAGTDLTVQIEEQPVQISDGVISEEDMKRGSAGYYMWLPAGEVYLVPVVGTANGKVVIEKYFYAGKIVKGLTLTFIEGKVVSMTAKSGIKRLKEVYDAAGEGKEKFAFIDFGINPNVKIPNGSDMVTYMSAGMVTVGIGGNAWAGGENNIGYELHLHLTNATATIDGKAIVENEKLKK